MFIENGGGYGFDPIRVVCIRSQFSINIQTLWVHKMLKEIQTVSNPLSLYFFLIFSATRIWFTAKTK